MSIIVSEKGMNAKKIEATSIAAENYLQEYIKNNPQSIPLDEISEDLRLLILAREFPTTSGQIDALGIDQEGNIYVIETKLAKNPDKRYVIAQVLDYGAALWRHSENMDDFMSALEEAVARTFGCNLTERLERFVGDADDVPALLTAVRANVAAGELRFVVLMDHLEDRLKNLLTFLNRNSQFTIYGVEMEFYKFDKYEILIPKLFGTEATKEPPKPRAPGAMWDETSFFEDAENRDKRKVERIRALYEQSKSVGEVTIRSPAKAARIDVRLNNIGRQPFYSIASHGGPIVLNFNWLPEDENSVAIASRFCQTVKGLPGFEKSPDFLARRERQKIDFDQWSQSIAFFIEAVSGMHQPVSQSEIS